MIQQYHLLESIEINYGNTTIKTYEFLYNENGFYTHLEEIILTDNIKQQHFNPTTFEWGEEEDDFSLETTNIQNSTYYADYTMGDYNGDGKTDVVCAYYEFDENLNKRVYHHWSVCYAGVDGVQFNEGEPEDFSSSGNVEFSSFISGDFNGDGLDDLILKEFHYVSQEYSYYKLLFRYSTGTGFDGNNDAITFIPAGDLEHQEDYQHYFRTGDFNGNGIIDLLVVRIYPDEDDSFVTSIRGIEYDIQSQQFIDLFTNPPSTVGYYFIQPLNSLFPVQVADFNGDGKTDLLVNDSENHSTIFELNETESKLEEIHPGGFGFPTKYHRVFTGDFNADGIADILTFAYTNPSYNWELHYFNGKDAWIEEDCPLSRDVDPEASLTDDIYAVSDYNGDGKSDIMEVYEVYENGNFVSKFNMYYSNGLEFITETDTFDDIFPYIQHFYPYFDFNGDGKQDCFLDIDNWDDPRKVLFFHKDEQKHFVHKVTDGFDRSQSVIYSSLTDNFVFTKNFDPNDPPVYPLRKIQPALYVTKETYSDNGAGVNYINKYSYKGAMAHLRGKGFLGFEEMTSIFKLIKTVTVYNEVNPEYFISLPVMTESKVFDDVIESVVHKYLIEPLDPMVNKRIYPYLDFTYSEISDLNGAFVKSSKSMYNYDD